MEIKKTVLSKEQIQARVTELGQEITSDYGDKKLVMLGVLNGAFIFTADLCRAVDLELEIDFIRVASYGNATHSSGTIRLSKPSEIDLKGKHVLLVEDIIDTGHTLAWLTSHFAEMGAESVKICALINKHERREVEVQVDYSGFSIDQGYLVGYGLDCAEIHRNLPQVYSLAD
ncbi:hypoxanthine phosphoribosyltransferase [Desulfogranum mediterraneum]|uniref:hypoxanthine phosphoribosyltransferase n=1 Tax=Desulfogranum mediterraneum TaxID=160661 RepID=UPI00048B1291|nr:hypoxanthine phosphoribosyltransferase [Desulfogranum mediterraneum]